MSNIEEFFQRYQFVILSILVGIASIFLCIDISRPLVDFDEATYAKVVVDTMHSGQFASFKLADQNWFEKPPLFLWIDMASVKIFGESEMALRVPAILLTLLCCWLLYLIILQITASQLAAALGFLVLLFTHSFFVLGREVRLDSGVLAAILAALLFWFKSEKEEKYLLWILPMLGIGFLFKSVVALLGIPIILIYAAAHRRWDWIQNRNFWYGALPALLIVVPWHLWETWHFGRAFWDSYLGYHVLQRSVSTITGTNNTGDYVTLLMAQTPWIWVLFALAIFILGLKMSDRYNNRVSVRDTGAAIAIIVFLTIIFTIARTHLPVYLLPAFPFLALAIAVSVYDIGAIFKNYKPLLYGVCIFLVLYAGWFCVSTRNADIPWGTAEEKAIGQIYRGNVGTLYALDWGVRESIDYYGDTKMIRLDPKADGGKRMTAPFYLVVTQAAQTYFVGADGVPMYPGLKVLFQSSIVSLIRAEQDLQLPQFVCCSR